APSSWTPGRPTRPAPQLPSPEQIRGYFDGLVSTLEADPAAARDVLAAAFSSARLVPTASATAWSSRWRKSAVRQIGGAGLAPAAFGLWARGRRSGRRASQLSFSVAPPSWRGIESTAGLVGSHHSPRVWTRFGRELRALPFGSETRGSTVKHRAI